MAWRLVRSLETLRTQVRKASPRAVPPATAATAWGTVGDTSHQAGTSDHNPAVYKVLGSTPVVCAADFPHAPALGLDGGAYTESLRQSRDKRTGYVIFNGRIFSGHAVDGVPAFTWRRYTGSDQHRDHWHVSTVHTTAADDTAPWRMPGAAAAGAPMPTQPEQAALNADNALYHALKGDNPIVGNKSVQSGTPVEFPNILAIMKGQLDTLVARPVAGNVTPTEEQWAALTASIASTLETLFAEKVGAAAEVGAEAAIRKVLGSLDGAVPPAPAPQ